MPDVYVQYYATMSGTHNVFQVFVKVPRGEIDEYRKAHGGQTSDNGIARKLPEKLAKTRPYLLQLHEYSLGVYYSDNLPASLTGYQPVFKQDGLSFWEA
jgi:hypothetical protein